MGWFKKIRSKRAKNTPAVSNSPFIEPNPSPRQTEPPAIAVPIPQKKEELLQLNPAAERVQKNIQQKFTADY